MRKNNRGCTHFGSAVGLVLLKLSAIVISDLQNENNFVIREGHFFLTHQE